MNILILALFKISIREGWDSEVLSLTPCNMPPSFCQTDISCCLSADCWCNSEAVGADCCSFSECQGTPQCSTPISVPEGAYTISDNHLSLNLEPSNEIMVIRIYSVSGKSVLSKTYSSTSSVNLDISKLRRGIYILQVYSGSKKVINAKFIKE